MKWEDIWGWIQYRMHTNRSTRKIRSDMAHRRALAEEERLLLEQKILTLEQRLRLKEIRVALKRLKEPPPPPAPQPVHQNPRRPWKA